MENKRKIEGKGEGKKTIAVNHIYEGKKTLQEAIEELIKNRIKKTY